MVVYTCDHSTGEQSRRIKGSRSSSHPWYKLSSGPGQAMWEPVADRQTDRNKQTSKQANISLPRETSLTSSAAAWQPWTSILVQVDKSRWVSTLKRCISMPCREPVLVAKVRSDPREGDRHPEPEWTNLGSQIEQRAKVITALLEKMPETYKNLQQFLDECISKPDCDILKVILFFNPIE